MEEKLGNGKIGGKRMSEFDQNTLYKQQPDK